MGWWCVVCLVAYTLACEEIVAGVYRFPLVYDKFLSLKKRVGRRRLEIDIEVFGDEDDEFDEEYEGRWDRVAHAIRGFVDYEMHANCDMEIVGDRSWESWRKMFAIVSDVSGWYQGRFDLSGRYDASRSTIILGGGIEARLAETALPDLVMDLPTRFCMRMNWGEYVDKKQLMKMMVSSPDILQVSVGGETVSVGYELKSDCSMVLTSNDAWDALLRIRKRFQEMTGDEVGSSLRFDPTDSMIVMGDWLPLTKLRL
jgi:hypothetical protein